MPSNGFNLSVRSNIDNFLARVDDTEKWRVPYVTASALTATAYDAKADEVEVMAKVFDRPTRFTLNALYVKGARKDNLVATVEFKEGFGSIPAWRYLGPQIMGGKRAYKSHEKRLISAGIMESGEYAVPGRAVKLDAYGRPILNRMRPTSRASARPSVAVVFTWCCDRAAKARATVRCSRACMPASHRAGRLSRCWCSFVRRTTSRAFRSMRRQAQALPATSHGAFVRTGNGSSRGWHPGKRPDHRRVLPAQGWLRE